MRIREVIGDWLLNTDIVTEAMNRSRASERISGLTVPLVQHLIKVLKWTDQTNYYKHLRDIDSWIEQIDDVVITGGKSPTIRDYTSWILDYSNLQISKWYRILDKNYNTLPVKADNETVTIEVNRILNLLISDLADNNFNSIERYLK